MGIYSTSLKYQMFCVLYYNHILSFVMCTSLKPHRRGTFVKPFSDISLVGDLSKTVPNYD